MWYLKLILLCYWKWNRINEGSEWDNLEICQIKRIHEPKLFWYQWLYNIWSCNSYSERIRKNYLLSLSLINKENLKACSIQYFSHVGALNSLCCIICLDWTHPSLALCYSTKYISVLCTLDCIEKCQEVYLAWIL